MRQLRQQRDALSVKHLFVFLMLLICASRAHSMTTEFRGIVLQSIEPFQLPDTTSPRAGFTLKEKEEVYVIGNSVGGGWMRILNANHEDGWLPATRLDLHRLAPMEYDDLAIAYDHFASRTSRYTLNSTVIEGSAPRGLGLGLDFTINTRKVGLTGYKDDQLEWGIGYHYHFGSPRDTGAGGSFWGSALSVGHNPWWEIPVYVQWLFRYRPFGSIQVGPRLGVAVSRDPRLSTIALPIEVGYVVRYYPEANWGFLFENSAMIRSVADIKAAFGATYRWE